MGKTERPRYRDDNPWDTVVRLIVKFVFADLHGKIVQEQQRLNITSACRRKSTFIALLDSGCCIDLKCGIGESQRMIAVCHQTSF
jgi:hypothetical protein